MPLSEAAQQRVMVISFDGLRPDAITAQVAPNLWGMGRAGAMAEHAINDMPPATLPNHATMLTGVTADQHGVWVDIILPGVINRPTLMDYAASTGLRTAFFASKTKFNYLATPAAQIVDIASSRQITEDLLGTLTADGPDVYFVHFADPDSTGHHTSWMSQPYLDALTSMDALLGEIVLTAGTDSSRPTYYLITADHGGLGKSHLGNLPVVRAIPWMVVGPDIQPGVLLPEVSIADTLPTALWLAGVPVPPGLSGVVRDDVKGAPRQALAELEGLR